MADHGTPKTPDEPDGGMFHDENDASGGLFGLRYLIGALFALYGVVLVVASPFVDDTKADGLDMNLWLGLGMGALGVFFLVWARLRPIVVEGESALAQAERRESEARIRRTDV